MAVGILDLGLVQARRNKSHNYYAFAEGKSLVNKDFIGLFSLEIMIHILCYKTNIIIRLTHQCNWFGRDSMVQTLSLK